MVLIEGLVSVLEPAPALAFCFNCVVSICTDGVWLNIGTTGSTNPASVWTMNETGPTAFTMVAGTQWGFLWKLRKRTG